MSRRIKPACILHHHATRRCSSSQSTQIPFSSRKSPIISSSSITTGPFIRTQKHNFSGDNFGREEFPGGRFAIPSATGAGKRPSVRVGGGGISLGPEFEPELEGLPWEPADIHPERPPPGFMNIDGFYDDDMQVDGKKYQHSILVMPQFVVKWNATNIDQVTPEHFALATIHYPAITHIFVGCGYSMPCPTPPQWVDYLSKYRITVEITALATAARLFNMQNTLFQNFGCALIYDKDVVNRFHSLVRKVDLNMPDPQGDPLTSGPGASGSYYHGRKKWE